MTVTEPPTLYPRPSSSLRPSKLNPKPWVFDLRFQDLDWFPKHLFFQMSGPKHVWESPNIGVPYFGVHIIRILLFRVLY